MPHASDPHASDSLAGPGADKGTVAGSGRRQAKPGARGGHPSEELTAARVHLLRLRRSRPTPFRLQPDARARKVLAQELGLLSLPRLQLVGRLIPRGQHDWELQAELGASVVQPCVVTLAPVRSRIDAPVERLYLANYVEPAAEESEIPEDDLPEPLPDSLDLGALLREELALALPLYPRAPDAPEAGAAREFGTAEEPTPEAERKVLPFAALAELRRTRDEGSAPGPDRSDENGAGDGGENPP